MNKLTDDQVREIREAHCVSREDLEAVAKKLGLTFRYAFDVARGRRYPSIVTGKQNRIEIER